MKRITSFLTLALLFSFSVTSFAQDNSKYGETEEQQRECMEALSVYKSFKKQKNYDDAYPAWQEACAVCPAKVTEGLYIDGARFIKAELKKEQDEARKAVLFDSLMANYDKRMELYPSTSKRPNNKAYVMGFKADDYNRYVGEDVADAKKHAFEMFKESLDGMQENAASATFSGYYISLFYTWKAAEGEEQENYNAMLYEDYIMLQDYISKKIKSEREAMSSDGGEGEDGEDGDDGATNKTIDRLEKAQNNIDKVFVTIADCESMVPVLQKKVEKNPDNFEVKKKALRLMNQKECDDSAFYLEIARAVDAQEPSATSKYSIGLLLAKEGKYSESLKYLEEAAEMCGDCTDQEIYYLKAGQVASVLKQGGKARSYASKVLSMNSKSGAAYLLHGDAIAGMSVSDDFGGRSVYWLATDYYNRAKNVDASLAERANKKIGNAKKQYPTVEEIFTAGLKQGASYTVLGESTTIRAR